MSKDRTGLSRDKTAIERGRETPEHMSRKNLNGVCAAISKMGDCCDGGLSIAVGCAGSCGSGNSEMSCWICGEPDNGGETGETTCAGGSFGDRGVMPNSIAPTLDELGGDVSNESQRGVEKCDNAP